MNYHLLRNIFRRQIKKLSFPLPERSFLVKINEIINNSPGYKTFFSSRNVDFPIKSLEEFESLPVLSKDDLTSIGEMNFLSSKYNGKRPLVFLPSSGAGGLFSFGIFYKSDFDKAELFQDLLLDMIFNVLEKSTLIINTLSMGIYITSRFCSVINTSVRFDTAIEVVRRLRDWFDQIILIGDNTFVKNLLELGFSEGIADKLILIIGEEPFPESYREYIKESFGIKKIFSSFGMAEVGLNMCFETPFSIAYRGYLIENNLKKHGFYPMVFQYSPRLFRLEAVNDKLIITTLMENFAMPLLRYGGEEIAEIIPYDIASKELGVEDEYLKWPLCLIWGKERFVEVNGQRLYVEQVKDVFYKARDVVPHCTGAFKLSVEEDNCIVNFELKEGRSVGEEKKRMLESIFKKELGYSPVLRFSDKREFPCWDYERKLKYID